MHPAAPHLTAPAVRLSATGRRAHAPQITRLMALALETPGLLSLAAGFTDNKTLPAAFITEAVTTLAREAADDPDHLQYGTNQGRLGLRREIARRLVAREPALDAAALSDSTFITNGSQQALYLAMQVLCEPGDIVLVDRPSYFVFLEMLAGMGIEARSIPTTEDGRVDGSGLRRLLREIEAGGERQRLKAVYFVSYFSNPSGRTLAADDKDQIAHALGETGFVVPVLEDAAYRDLFFDRAPAASSVLSRPAWSAFPRLYAFTLTKPFASGLKVGGGICTDPAWRSAMLHVKGHQDFGTANFNQTLCERALLSGAFDEHLTVLRASYRTKMHLLHDTLETAGLRDLGWRWQAPEGGLYLWLQAPAGLDTGIDSDFCRACLAEGVLYVPGELCHGDAPPADRVRLSYGVLNGERLAEAGRRFATAARGFA